MKIGEAPKFYLTSILVARQMTTKRVIPDSYFAGLEVPDGEDYQEWDISSTGTLNPLVNAYGQLRTPWNQKDDKFVGREAYTYGKTRYDTFPGCSTAETFYDTESLGEMMNGLNGALHGPVHIMIGGAWSDEVYDGNELIDLFRSTERILYFKILWRSGITRCPTRCDAGEECVCSIPIGCARNIQLTKCLQGYYIACNERKLKDTRWKTKRSSNTSPQRTKWEIC